VNIWHILRTTGLKGADSMSRSRWPLAAIAGMAFAACTFLPGCEDESGSKTANDPAPAKAKASRSDMAQQNLKTGEAFLAANSKKEGVKTRPSGLQYLVLKEGNGKTPTKADRVEVHYHGTLINGKVFDSSVDRGEPITFGVTQVIPGWQEALQLMKEGDKWRVFVPSDIAYGAKGTPGGPIGPNEVLIFEIELLHVK
jgi:FKBP-type peptidyl-prolyl cis-trans isomerase FklB